MTSRAHAVAAKLLFASPLVEGVIVSRPNRFIMHVKLPSKKEEVLCHCPVTGMIGGMRYSEMANLPCLLSPAQGDPEKRKTEFTVEAIAFDHPSSQTKSWVGINQNAANRYVEYFLKQGCAPELAKDGAEIKRERKLIDSRIDFSIGLNTYLEVKTPMEDLSGAQGWTGVPFSEKPDSYFEGSRLVKHFTTLGENLEKQNEIIKNKEGKKNASEDKDKPRAISLLLRMYPQAPPFQPPRAAESSSIIVEAVTRARARGLEFWQMNVKVSPDGVSFEKVLKLDIYPELNSTISRGVPAILEGNQKATPNNALKKKAVVSTAVKITAKTPVRKRARSDNIGATSLPPATKKLKK